MSKFVETKQIFTEAAKENLLKLNKIKQDIKSLSTELKAKKEKPSNSNF